MHHALLMCCRQGFGDRDAQCEHALDRQALGRDMLVQPAALDEFHGQKVRAGVVLDRVERDDVRMVEPGHGACLVLEACHAFGIGGHCWG